MPHARPVPRTSRADSKRPALRRPALRPPSIEHPAHRLHESRRIATGAGWHERCPDPLCRHGGCGGTLRSYAGGPRSFPTCLHIALRMFHDPAEVTLREAEAFMHFLHPGEGWTFGPVPPGHDRRDDLIEEAGTSEHRSLTESQMLLLLMDLLGREGGATSGER